MKKGNGIATIGTCLVDKILPAVEPGQLVYVDAAEFVDESELMGEQPDYSVGGMALNVGVDLTLIGGGYPVDVYGKVGNDSLKEIITNRLRENGINEENLVTDPELPTSSTEVIYLMMPGGSMERIFRHRLGAMGTFSPRDVEIDRLADYKIAMFGYALLMPMMDMPDQEYGTQLGKLLHDVGDRGVITAIDFVSPNRENMFRYERYKTSLRWVDICCINYDQAVSLTGRCDPAEACRSLVNELGAGTAVVHCGAEGPNYAYSRETGLLVQSNIHIKPEEYKGNAGAGDAFSAGFLHGMYQEWTVAKSLKFAAGAAAQSLKSASCTGAMCNEKEIMELIRQSGEEM